MNKLTIFFLFMVAMSGVHITSSQASPSTTYPGKEVNNQATSELPTSTTNAPTNAIDVKKPTTDAIPSEGQSSLPASTDMPIPEGQHCKEAGHFMCGNWFGSCIPNDKVCDGVKDCEHGEDEDDCDDKLLLPSSDEYLEVSHLFCDGFKCANNKCISDQKQCNGVNDCGDGSDENELCNGCDNFMCSHECKNTVRGPVCTCPSNMQLSVDGMTCEYVNHCEKSEHRCAQHCKPNIDRLECECADGYSLHNQYECLANEEFRNGDLFFTHADRSVRRAALFDDSKPTTTFVPALPLNEKIDSLAFDPENKNLFIAANDHRHSKILQFHEGDAETKFIYQGSGIKNLAFDWITGNLYYAADGLGIGVCTNNGRYCSHLLTGLSPHEDALPQTYGSLIAHPKRGAILWIDSNYEHPNGVIKIAGMDGKKERIIGGNHERKVLMISMDYVRDQLYILEGEELFVVDLHTLEKRAVTNRIHPFAMVPFNSHLFYIARENKKLSKVKITETSGVPMNAVEGDKFSMAINNDLYHVKYPNPCEDLKCSHMCVLRESGSHQLPQGTCICPDKYTLQEDGLNCVFDRSFDGPVKTSTEQMDVMCAKDSACYYHGKCKDSYPSGSHTTPACECLPKFSGLYCEIAPNLSFMDVATSGGWLTFVLLVLLGSLIVPLILYLLRNYPDLPRQFGDYILSFWRRGGTTTNIDRFQRNSSTDVPTKIIVTNTSPTTPLLKNQSPAQGFANPLIGGTRQTLHSE